MSACRIRSLALSSLRTASRARMHVAPSPTRTFSLLALAPRPTTTNLRAATGSTTGSRILDMALPAMQQVRCMSRGDEYQPSQRVRKRRHGFLARKKTKGGRAVLARRLKKGRRFLSH